MLSIDKCKGILSTNQDPNEVYKEYTNDEIRLIKELLETLALIEFENYKSNLREKTSTYLH